MDEIDAVIKVLNLKLRRINLSDDPPRIKLGDMGEALAKYGIKQCLFDRDFRVGQRGSRTFTLQRHYRAGEQGIGSIDDYLKFRVKWWKKYRCFVEVKNWTLMRNGIDDDIFESEILDRFRKNDRFGRRFWALAITEVNVRYIEERCRRNNIRIIPIAEYLTDLQMEPMFLKPILEQFMEEFSQVIDDIVSGRLRRGNPWGR